MAVTLTRVMSNALTIKRAIDRLTGGKAPALKVGSISLDGFESPSKLPWGVEHRHGVSHIPGGGKVLDSQGPTDKNISFDGMLRGPGSAAKARQLQGLVEKGLPVPMVWADFFRMVVPVDFEADYENAGQLIPYRMTVVVIPFPPPPRPRSFLQRLWDDISESLGLSRLTPLLNTAQQYLGYAQEVAGVVGVVSPRLGMQIGGVLSGAQGVVGGALGASEGRLMGLGEAAAGVGGIASAVRPTGSRGRDIARGLEDARIAAHAQAVSIEARDRVARARMASAEAARGGAR